MAKYLAIVGYAAEGLKGLMAKGGTARVDAAHQFVALARVQPSALLPAARWPCQPLPRSWRGGGRPSPCVHQGMVARLTYTSMAWAATGLAIG
jgi:hypothetical protein